MEIKIEKFVLEFHGHLNRTELLALLFEPKNGSVQMNGFTYPSYSAAARFIHATYPDVTVTHICKTLARDGRFKEFTLDSKPSRPQKKRMRPNPVEQKQREWTADGFSCTTQ